MYTQKASTSKASSFEDEETYSSSLFGYTHEDHSNALLTNLHNIYLKQVDPACNVSIEVNGVHLIRAHSIVLAICSQYFETALDSVVQPKANITFDLSTKAIPITRETLLEVINYMYTGVIVINPHILRTAKVLRCRNLEIFVTQKLAESNETSRRPHFPLYRGEVIKNIAYNSSHPADFIKAVRNYRLRNKFVDCVLQIKKTTLIRVHRCILSAFSPVLYDLICSIGLKAAITLQYDDDAFFITTQEAKDVIGFMYSGELNNLKKSQLENLLVSAEKLKFERLRRLIRLMLCQIEEEKKLRRRRQEEEQSRGITEEELIEMDVVGEYEAIYEHFVSGPVKKKVKKTKIDLKKASTFPKLDSDAENEKNTSENIGEGCSNGETIGEDIEMTEKPYKCQYCDHRAKTKSTLQKHVRSIHTFESPYKCEICGLGFKVQSNYARHKRTHSGEKPYKCTKCGAEYADKKNIDRHVFQDHINAQEVKCTYSGCRSKFWRRDRYMIHYKKYHGGIPDNLFV